MHEAIRDRFVVPAATSQDVLTGLLRQGAQQMLAQAIDAEVAQWIESHRDIRDEAGHRCRVSDYLTEKSLFSWPNRPSLRHFGCHAVRRAGFQV